MISNIAVTALTTVGEHEFAVPIDLDPPSIEEANRDADDVQPSTSTGITGQKPVTEVSAVSKPKGRAAKRARHNEEITSAMSSNTAVTYLDLATDEPVSKKGNTFPAYLLKAAPTTLGIEELRKHGIISDIEKKQSLNKNGRCYHQISSTPAQFFEKN